jgi:hypothetical protein
VASRLTAFTRVDVSPTAIDARRIGARRPPRA